jgi:hypothetical protein
VTRRHEAPDNGNQENIMIERRTLLSTIALCTLVLFATTASGYVGPAFADKGSSHDGGGNDDGGNSGRGGNDDGGNSGRGGSDDNGSDDSNSGSDSSGRGGSDDPAGHDANDDNGNDVNDAPDDSDDRDDNARNDSIDDNPGASTRNRGGRTCAAGTNCAKG